MLDFIMMTFLILKEIEIMLNLQTQTLAFSRKEIQEVSQYGCNIVLSQKINQEIVEIILIMILKADYNGGNRKANNE
jgi:hypothetical protein